MVPYPSFDDVDEAIKPLSAGVTLWVADYPDTQEGNEALDKVLKQPVHTEKLARFAAMECDEADTFPGRVVMRAKLIIAELEGAAAPDPPTAPHIAAAGAGGGAAVAAAAGGKAPASTAEGIASTLGCHSQLPIDLIVEKVPTVAACMEFISSID